MKSKPPIFIVICLSIIFILSACKKDEPQALGRNFQTSCGVTEKIAQSRNDCQCSIIFRDYVNTYTFTSIESTYNILGPACKQNLFTIKYINSTHDHNETDFEFGFYLPQFTNEEFFRIDTFRVDTIYYGEWRPSGGHGGPRYDADVVFIWDEVYLNEGIYSGEGKFIINKRIPVNYPATFFFPAQEIPFEFCELRR